MGWVHPSGLGGQNAAVGIEDTGSPPHPRRLVTSATPKKVEIHVREEKHIANRFCFCMYSHTLCLFANRFFKLTD